MPVEASWHVSSASRTHALTPRRSPNDCCSPVARWRHRQFPASAEAAGRVTRRNSSRVARDTISTEPMRFATAAAVVVAAAAQRVNLADAANCPTDQFSSSLNSQYAACQSASGFSVASPEAVSYSAFCGSSVCKTFWDSMNSANYLRCFQYPKDQTTGFALKNANSAANCFNTYLKSPATAPAPAPVSGPAPAPDSVPAPAPASDPATTSPTVATTTPSAPASSPASDSGSPTVTPADTPSSPSSATKASTPSSKSPTTSSGSGATPSGGDSEGGAGAGSKRTDKELSGSPSTASDGGEGANKENVDTGTKAGTSIEGESVKGSSASSPGSTSATTGNNASNRKKSSEQSSTSGPGDDSDKNSDRESGGSTAYVVAGGSSGATLVLVFVVIYFRKRKDREAQVKKLDEDGPYFPTLQTSRSRESSESVVVMGDTGFVPVVIQSKSGLWEDEDITAARIPFEKLKRQALISRGGYGEVYKGTYRDEVVAIKTLLPERRKDLKQIEKFLAEVKLMTVLEHDHIVRFVGVAWDSLNELCVVSEFMANGDLRSLLMEYDADPVNHPKGFSDDKIKIALHVAHALTYMHSLQPMVLHRDLKSRNILLDAHLNAKLTDFGISREHVDTTMTVGVGSSLWIAPEVMTGGRYNEKADVFSFGVVLSELDTHLLPYSHAVETGTGGRKLPDTVIVQMVTTSRLTVQFSDEESPVARIGRRCVDVDPENRPSTAELQHHFHQLWRNFDISM